MTEKKLKVAIVHDWLTNRGGAEKVVLAIHELYPDAPIYTSAYLPESLGMPEYDKLDVRTTFIQRLPFFKSHHKFAFLLRALAFWRLDLSDYDLVISSTTAEAKGVKTKKRDGSGALHICYCNTPTRYYWSGFEDYVREPGFGWLNPLARFKLRLLIRPLRWIDLKLASRPDVYIGNSKAVAERIRTYYGKRAHVLFPAVDTSRFECGKGERKGFIVAGRQVPYKRVDLAIEACNKLELPLTVIGNGSEYEKLAAMAGPTVTMMQADDKALVDAFESAEALIYPGEEDAGIVPVEAMAAGTPVIAYGKGGSLDSVIGGKTGLLFSEQSVASLTEALKKFQSLHFDHQAIRAHAIQFDTDAFQKNITSIIEKSLRGKG